MSFENKNQYERCPQILLTASEAQRVLSLPPSTLYKHIKRDPTFPKRRKIGQSIRFLYSELKEWAEALPTIEIKD